MEQEEFCPRKIIAELLLEHGVLKGQLAGWLTVSVNTINLILQGNQVSRRVERELLEIYRKHKVAEFV